MSEACLNLSTICGKQASVWINGILENGIREEMGILENLKKIVWPYVYVL